MIGAGIMAAGMAILGLAYGVHIYLRPVTSICPWSIIPAS
jgi:hypothetical protein